MLRQSNPDCLCIAETKISNASSILATLGFVDSLEVPAEGLKGGMVFAWRKGFEFDLVVQNQHIFSIMVYGEPSFQPWALTFIHSQCDSVSKENFWL